MIITPTLTKKDFLWVNITIWVLLILTDCFLKHNYTEGYRGYNIEFITIKALSPLVILLFIHSVIEKRNVLIALPLSIFLYIIAVIIWASLDYFSRIYFSDDQFTRLDMIVFHTKSRFTRPTIFLAFSISITHYLLYQLETTIVKYRAKKKRLN